MFSRRTGWNLAANRYTDALEKHRKSGRELFDLTASNPTTVGLTYRESTLAQSLANPSGFTYEPIAKGLRPAREAISDYYAEKGAVISPDNLVLTTSTSEAYSFAFRLLCDAGDAVLVPVPSYPLFDFLADLNDVKLAPYELVYDHGWQVDFTSLQAAIKRAQSEGGTCRAVLVVHPNNPTGSFIKPIELAELNRICAAHKLALISDEVFLDYRLTGAPPHTFAANSDGLTFTLSGLSKVSALPQMKVAWIVTSGPVDLQRDALARLDVIADTYLSMNAPVQLAVPELLTERLSIQPQLLHRIQTNLAALDARLADQTLCARLNIEGGWYALLRVPALGSDEDLAVSLLDATGVLVQPGHFYNFAGDGHLIVSLITPTEVFAKGLSRLLGAVADRSAESAR
jgi:aspartate/methionine/tyrosine aminotransferase